MVKPSGYRRATGEPADPQPANSRGWPRYLLVPAFAVLTGACVYLVAGNRAVDVFQTWLHGLLVLPLVISAAMLGIALTQFFTKTGAFADSPWPDLFRLILSIALGLGAFAFATLVFGALHLLNPPWLPLLLMGLAVAIGIVPTRNFLNRFDWSPMRTRCRRGEWMILLAGVPVAILLIAVTFPPGTLWVSEGRGYDVLEYHLEMPREYGDTNSIAPVSHNVYSYLPANVEMLYLLLMQTGRFAMGSGGGNGGPVSGPDHLWGVFPAQMLHACLALLSVLAIGTAPVRMKAIGRIAAMVAVLAIPWTIVTASLAYDEWGMVLYGTLALGLAMGNQKGASSGVLIGVMLGLAVGCKMTAGVFFAAPVAVILLLRGRWKATAIAALTALALYAPWAIRAAVGSGGNPLFPLAANILPHDGWTADQVARFNRGHAALAEEQSFGGRLVALVRESVLNDQWSPGWGSIYVWAGERPPPAEAWWKHVGVLWLVVPLAIVLGFLRGVGSRAGSRGRELSILLLVLVLQLAAWTFLTHLQSRFLLPMVVPLAWLVGIGVEGGGRGGVLVRTLQLLVATVVGAAAICTVFLLLPEVGLLGGVQNVGKRRHEPPPIGELYSRVANVVAAVEKPGPRPSLPEGKVLLEGDAMPLFWDGEIVYNTTFDQNLLGDALRAGGPEGAARWLREQGFNYVVIDWSEVNRLRGTYGFDEAITPEAIDGLVRAGVKRVEADVPAGITVLQVKAVGK
ncbi:MAG TPA: hypothetical protein VM008_02520 [Phycisphaerae bacterium]|nr:hypothetical protein [Phycisphaerae bacterium]